jgi:hypothetical protein
MNKVGNQAVSLEALMETAAPAYVICGKITFSFRNMLQPEILQL